MNRRKFFGVLGAIVAGLSLKKRTRKPAKEPSDVSIHIVQWGDQKFSIEGLEGREIRRITNAKWKTSGT